MPGYPISRVECVAFDKTGTLTTGEFCIDRIDSRIGEDDLIRILASVEYNSNHPIARCIKKMCSCQEKLAG